MNNDLKWSEFERVDMRVGTIISVSDFPEARKPAFQLHIDFGEELGVRTFKGLLPRPAAFLET